MIDLTKTYNIEDILHKYPRSVEKLQKWFFDQLKNSQMALIKEAGGSEEEINKAFEDHKEQIGLSIAPHFTYNARDLYEFFDENELNIEVSTFKGGFGVQIDNWLNDNSFPSRWEAEKNGFDRAFNILESKFN